MQLAWENGFSRRTYMHTFMYMYMYVHGCNIGAGEVHAARMRERLLEALTCIYKHVCIYVCTYLYIYMHVGVGEVHAARMRERLLEAQGKLVRCTQVCCSVLQRVAACCSMLQCAFTTVFKL